MVPLYAHFRGRQALAVCMLFAVNGCVSDAAPRPPARVLPYKIVTASQLGHDPTVAVSANGRRFATCDGSGVVKLWDVRTTEQTNALATEPLYGSVFFSPDGHRLALVRQSDGSILIWNIDEETVLRVEHGERWPGWPRFAKSGRYILSTSNDGTSRLIDATNGTVVRHVAAEVDTSRFEDGILLRHAGDLRIEDAPSGHEIARLPVGSGVLSPDLRVFATGFADRFELWDVAARERLELPFNGPSHASPIGFSPDGSRLVTSEPVGPWADLGLRMVLWDLDKRTKLTPVISEAHPIGNPWGNDTVFFYLSPWTASHFSPDGRFLLASGTENVELRDGRTGRRLHMLSGTKRHVWSAHFVSDGRTLVLTTTDAMDINGNVNPELEADVFDLETGAKLDELGRLCGVAGTTAIVRGGPGELALVRLER